MSGVSSPAASKMWAISIEMTARLTICCTAGARSAEDLPAQGALLASAGRTVWKNPTASWMSRASSLVAASANAVESASTAMSVVLAFFGRLALLYVEDPLAGAGKRKEPFLWRPGKPLAVVGVTEHGATDVFLSNCTKRLRNPLIRLVGCLQLLSAKLVTISNFSSITATVLASSIPACLRASCEYWPSVSFRRKRFSVPTTASTSEPGAQRLRCGRRPAQCICGRCPSRSATGRGARAGGAGLSAQAIRPRNTHLGELLMCS